MWIALKEIGCENILITGTHENTENVINTLYSSSNQIIPYHWDRLPGSYHGSGCTLTAAISAYYALGLSIGEAVEEAQHFTWQALKNGFKPGMGQLIPNRFFQDNDLRMMENLHIIKGLYAITPEESDLFALSSKVESCIKGGARLIQYRSKTLSKIEQNKQARRN